MKITNKICFRIYQSLRVLAFKLLSNLAPAGDLIRIQPVQTTGSGKIIVKGSVTIGYFPSPHFFSTYGYLEARESGAILEIGNDTKINNGFVAVAESSSITIGENCLIGTRVEIYDSDFHSLNAVIRMNGDNHTAMPVKIGNSVFIGSNVKILKGVTIGEGAVIANSSLVTKDVPANCLVSGVPAVFVRRV